MTLKNKNRIFLFLFISSAVIFLFNTALLFIAAASKSIVPPTSPMRPFVLIPRGNLCAYNFNSSLAAILLFSLSAPALSIIIFKGFEKTSSLEILFFSGFIVSCITESARIFLPLFGFWKTNSLSLIYIGRIVAAGRFLAPMSLFFAAVFSSEEELQNAERNIFVLLASTCAFGFFYPMDTTITTSTCTVLWGFRKFFAAIRVFIVIVTVFSVLAEAYSKGIKEIYTKALGLGILSAGYGLLCNTDCWLEFIAAVALYIPGSMIYLKTIHYLENTWN
ncbi:hypothetical protein [Treponema sp.]|uniref:hypothetical protein n=1 Tax=Treponema sp. TaxID=166 RepID=UPI003EFF63A6